MIILICLLVSVLCFSGKVPGDSGDVPINALCLDQELPKDGRIGYIADEALNPAEYMKLQYYLVPRVFERHFNFDECVELDWIAIRGMNPDEINSFIVACDLHPVAECGSEIVFKRGD